MSGAEPEIMREKYRLRGAAGDSTITLEWMNDEGNKRTKPATPAEAHLTNQVNSLIAALRVALRRNAEYEAARGVHAPKRAEEAA